MNLKKIRKVFTSKFVGTGPSSYKKRIYRAAVSQKLRNTVLHNMLCVRTDNHRCLSQQQEYAKDKQSIHSSPPPFRTGRRIVAETAERERLIQDFGGET